MYNSMTFYFSIMTADTKKSQASTCTYSTDHSKNLYRKECNPVPANLPGRV